MMYSGAVFFKLYVILMLFEHGRAQLLPGPPAIPPLPAPPAGPLPQPPSLPFKSPIENLDFVKDLVPNIAEEFNNPVTKATGNLTTDQLCAYYGYIPEVHFVTTPDNYILRIYRCNSKKTKRDPNKVMLLVHGILSSSDDFLTNPPDLGSAYVFADAGYDIWLGNWRGNTYSRNHTKLKPIQPEFWDFSYYEIGIIDIPAFTDYVMKQTGAPQVFIVAHSQGTASTMAMLSDKPEYNKKVAAYALMAPVGYLDHSDEFIQLLKAIRPLLETFARTEFLPRDFIIDDPGTLCGRDTTGFCDKLLSILFGPSDDQKNSTLLGTFLDHIPSGGSTKQLTHFVQEIDNKNFAKYMTNPLVVPTDYPLYKITAPGALFYSIVDRFTNPIDVKRLIPKLNNSVIYVQEMNKTGYAYNHVDFIWGKHAKADIYMPILSIFGKYTPQSASQNNNVNRIPSLFDLFLDILFLNFAAIRRFFGFV